MFTNSILSSLERGAEDCLPAVLRLRIKTIVALMPRMNHDQRDHADALILKLNRLLEEQYAPVVPNVSCYSIIRKERSSEHELRPLTLVEWAQIAA